MNDMELLTMNSEMAFNNVRNGIWDLATFQDWLNVREVEARNDAVYYATVQY